LMGYHIVNRVIPYTQLSCGDDRSIQMIRAGTSETQCRRNSPFAQQGTSPFAQQGTCNTEANLPTFTNTFSASNGGIYSVDNVLIPSPDGTLAGCTGIINGQCSAIQRCNTDRNACEDRDGCFGNWFPNGRNGYCANREGNIQRPDPNPRCETRDNCVRRNECSGVWVQNDNSDNNNNRDGCCYRPFEFDPPFFNNCVCDDNQCVNRIRFKYTREQQCDDETQPNDNLRSNYCEDIGNNPVVNREPPRPTYKVFECGVDFPELVVRGEQELPRGDDTVILDIGDACLPNCITIEIRSRNQGQNANRITQRFNINTGFNENDSSNCENVLVRNQDYGAFETVNNNNAFNCRDF